MEQQVTNPLLIMAINMTIVFAVLAALGVLIQITYWLDPTRKRVAKPAAPAATTAAPAPAPAAVVKNNDEVIAVITAAVVAMGYSAAQIASVRPHRSAKWTQEGRRVGCNRTTN